MATVLGFGGKQQSRRVMFRRKARDGKANLGEILTLGVIPRLLMAHGSTPVEKAAEDVLIEGDVQRLAPIAINEAAHVLLDEVETIMRRGVAAEDIFVDLLAPVARWMGEEWKEDRLSFIEVSMGLWRLQEVLRHISAGAGRAGYPYGQRTALFAAMPGEQHSFGAAMVHECFVIAGWDAELLLEANRQQLIEAVAGTSIDLVGLTLSCDCPADRIASLIRAIRSVSANPNLCVMIGGRLTIEQPNLVALAGADATAATAPDAVKLADRIVGAQRMAAAG